MKLTLILEYPTETSPLPFTPNRHEAKILQEVMDELRRRRIARRYCDHG